MLRETHLVENNNKYTLENSTLNVKSSIAICANYELRHVPFEDVYNI